MSRGRITPTQRQSLRILAGGCCEYCGLHEEDCCLPHEVDHAVAGQHRGETAQKNLAWACFHCNRLKGPNLASIDPRTGELTRLFHPRYDHWEEHYQMDGARIVPLTAIGRSTAELLRFNAMERLALREALLAAGRYPRREY